MSENTKVQLPFNAKNFMQRILNFGYSVYAVGGCVRDSLLDRAVSDYDFATNALPADIIGIFSDCTVIETGIKHGTVTVLFNDDFFEITTFRIDGEYLDSRHPSNVVFTDDLFEDLSRRDFTINAMAADIDGNIIDFFNGCEDLNNRIIRCVGNPIDRFNEDALRILRAFRFAAKIGGTIEANTAYAMRKCSHLLKNIAYERIQKELNGFLLSSASNNQVLELIESIDVFRVVIPELDYLNIEQNLDTQRHQLLLEHTANVVAKVPADLITKLAALFHDIGKKASKLDCGIYSVYPSHDMASSQIAETILRRLRYSNDVIKEVVWIIRMHHYSREVSKYNLKKLLNDAPSQQAVTRLFDLMCSNELDKKDPDISSYISLLKLRLDIYQNDEPYKLGHLKIDGNDLKALGLSGKDIGITLSKLLGANMYGDVDNDKEVLIKYTKEVLLNENR